MRVIIKGSFILGLLITCAVTPAVAQENTSDEIKRIRAEISLLVKRLDKLESQHSSELAVREDKTHAEASAIQTPKTTDAESKLLYNRFSKTGSNTRESLLETRPVVPSTLDRPLQSNGMGFELNTSTDSSTVAVKFAKTLSNPDLKNQRGVYDSIALVASAPLSKSSSISDTVTTDGFENSSKLRFQFSRYLRPVSSPVDDHTESFDEISKAVESACVSQANDAGSREKCKNNLLNNEDVQKYRPDLETAYLSLFRTPPGQKKVDWSARAFGIEGAIGYKSFSFLEKGNTKAIESNRIPVSGKVFYSYLPDVRRSSITGAAEYQRGYKDSTSGALCPENLLGAEVICLTGPIGSPQLDEKLLLSLEYRYYDIFRNNSFFPAIGVSPMITLDALSDDFRLDVPIHIVPNSTGGLTGGIRFGYDSEDQDLISGVFVSRAFALR